MKSFSFSRSGFVFFSILIWLSIVAAPLNAAEYEEETSSQDYLFVKGMVSEVSDDHQTIKIRQHKKPSITIFLSPETITEGFKKVKELQTRQTIKVWYIPDERGNKALKIVKPIDLGC